MVVSREKRTQKLSTKETARDWLDRLRHLLFYFRGKKLSYNDGKTKMGLSLLIPLNYILVVKYSVLIWESVQIPICPMSLSVRRLRVKPTT